MTKPYREPATKPEEVEAPQPIPRVPLVFAILGGLTIGLGLAARQFGAPGVVLGLAGAALIATIAAFWASVRTMLGEARISSADAFAIGNTGGAQEQKRAVLRALKDLEFERAVGKISEEDFKVLVARYRAEAKRLLKQIDDASAEQRARAEELVSKRLEKLGLLPPTPSAGKSEHEEEDADVAPARVTSEVETAEDEPSREEPDADAKSEDSEADREPGSAKADPEANDAEKDDAKDDREKGESRDA